MSDLLEVQAQLLVSNPLRQANRTAPGLHSSEGGGPEKPGCLVRGDTEKGRGTICKTPVCPHQPGKEAGVLGRARKGGTRTPRPPPGAKSAVSTCRASSY